MNTLLALLGAKDSLDDLLLLVIFVCAVAGIVSGLLRLAYRPGHTFRRSEYGRVKLDR
jgi:hypothetical protein